MGASIERNADISIEISAHLQYLALVRSFANCLAKHLNLAAEEAVQLEMCLDEACANSIEAIREVEGEHPRTKVRIDVEIKNDHFRITIHDNGKDFSRNFAEALPLCPSSDRTRTRGYGLQIIKTLMDEVHYVHDPQAGNRLHLVKFFARSGGESILG
ncbi:MAG: ATP-binding protein [Candidatus Omnitrophota bacterium]